MNTKTTIKIAIVDDHQIVIDGIIALLNNIPKIKIVLTATEGAKIINNIRNTEIDILITDMMMPQMSGRELANQVRTLAPHVRIIGLSMNSEAHLVQQLIDEANIAAYILKNSSKNELISCIEAVANGGTYFGQEIKAALKSLENKEKDPHKLSAREVEILRLIEKEWNTKQIAEHLFISERTVETHRKNIFRKTETHSVLGLIKYAYQQHLI